MNNSIDFSKVLEDYECIIFDFDGTLIDSEKFHLLAHNEVLSQILNREFYFSKEGFSKYLGKKDTQIFEQYKIDFNVDFDSQEMITKKVLAARDLLLQDEVKIFDYFYEILKVKGNKKFYIVSNQDDRILMPVLEKKGILSYFENVYCLPNMKLEKSYFVENLKEFINHSGKVAIFEDNKDILNLGKRLNMLTFGVETHLIRGKLNGNCDYLLSY